MKKIFFILILSLLGCSNKNSTTLLDGTWRYTSITCNGAPGGTSSTGAAARISNGAVSQITISGNRAVEEEVYANGCRITVPMDLSYSPGNIVSYTFNYAIGCSPAACAALCGVTPGITITSRYKLIGISKLELLNLYNSDSVCSGATPAEPDPLKFTFEKQ